MKDYLNNTHHIRRQLVPTMHNHELLSTTTYHLALPSGTHRWVDQVIRLDDVFLKPSRPSRGREGLSGVWIVI